MKLQYKWCKDKTTFEEKINSVFHLEHNYILSEKLFALNEDVDYVWKNYLKPILNDYKKNPELFYNALINNKKDIKKQFKSDELISEVSKEASKKFPILINVGFIQDGDYYSPIEKRISISFNIDVVKFLGKKGLSNKKAIKNYPLILNEVSEIKVKSSIIHELSHWLNDVFHNDIIKKHTERYLKLFNTPERISDIEWQILSFDEIDAYIHSLSSIKRSHEKKWDVLTFKDVITLDSGFKQLIIDLVNDLDEKNYKIWLRRFFSRLARENLLGKNMRYPSYEEAKNIKITND